MVVDFTVVTEPQIRIFPHSYGLHSKQGVNHRQAVKAKAAVGVSIDVLKAKCIWPPVRNLHRTQTLHRKAVIAAEEGPDATHATGGLQALCGEKHEVSHSEEATLDSRNLNNPLQKLDTNHLYPRQCSIKLAGTWE